VTTTGYDDLTQSLIAHRILRSASSVAERAAEPVEPEVLSIEDERRLEALMRLYTQTDDPATSPATTTPALAMPVTATKTSRRSWAMWVGVGLAAAAVLAVTLRGSLESPAPLGTRYELELDRELAVERGADAEAPMHVFREDRTLEVWLRPVDPVTPPLEVEVYARRRGEIHRLVLAPTTMNNGVMHIVTGVREAGLPTGEWELVFVVGRAGELPGIDDLPKTVDAMTLPYDVREVMVRVVPQPETTKPR
jgi:hypothetical protein